jgi:carbon monoxide dehydrogenase subunit G
VRREEDRAALGGEALEEIANPPDALGVEAVDGLVEHDDLRVAEQRVGDAEALAHSERELPRTFPRSRVEADELEQLGDPALRDAVSLREREQVVVGRAAGVHGLCFEQRSDLVEGRGVIRVVPACDGRVAVRRRVQAEDHRIVVDFPEPFGPRKPVTIPGRTENVLIARPPDEVFAFVADARNRPSWDESVDSEELTSPEPIAVGTTVRTRMRSMGRDYAYTWEVTRHDPPNRMIIESTTGPFPTTLDYQVEGRDGETSVEFWVTGRPAGVLRLFEPMIARTIQKDLDRGFARLKQVLEGSTGS